MRKFGMGTHEAYAYVKEKSPWIGPNMSLIYQLTDYSRLCGYERPTQNISNTPNTAPLNSSETRRYKESKAIPLHAKLRPSMGRTQSQDRPGFLDVEVDQVTETLSSPRFVVSEDGRKDDEELSNESGK
jgi:hypothetical protein